MILRRILEPLFLGSISNIVVNFLFNPNSYEFILDEFITACVLSTPITELNRYIDQQLERKISWIEYPRKRFTTHLLLLSFWLVIWLNTLGNAYLWITQQGFFSWKELGIINLVTLCLAICLTLLNWAVHFYFRWISAEANALRFARIGDDLRQKITQGSQLIELQKGTTKINIEPHAIRLAKIKYGIVRVYSEKGECGVFPGTLSQLNALLPDYLFFQVTRDAILHREVISSVSSSTFGKIQLISKESYRDASAFAVSRLKAAAFRKWYNSISTQKI